MWPPNMPLHVLDGKTIDPHDDVTLRAYLPDAYGPYGIDANRAGLMASGMVMHPALTIALSKRVDYENSDHGTACFAKHLDKYTLFPKSTPWTDTVTVAPKIAAPKTIRGQSDGGKWTTKMTEDLVHLHAQRVSFKDIAARFPGKEVKACQEHYYRVVKNKKWKDLHQELREKHNGKENMAVKAVQRMVHKDKMSVEDTHYLVSEDELAGEIL